MNTVQIIAQGFGIIGMILAIVSFQCKRNSILFFTQAASGLMFSVNFIMIGVIGAALCNAVNVIRGLLFSKSDCVVWKLIVVLSLYATCMIISLYTVWGNAFQTLLAMLPIIVSFVFTVAMWTGNGTTIRKMQFFLSSPLWLLHNCFNFSLGGIICESFNMLSVLISFIRYGKDGFEK